MEANGRTDHGVTPVLTLTPTLTLTQADGRTDHEAMPVHEGVKYGANM